MPEIETHKVDPSASSPGAILKRCRTYHEITLEEAEEATKIGVGYLRALEEDQISQFASLAYLKGFLRIYASFLGLNPDDMIRLYEKLYASRNVKDNRTQSALQPGTPRTLRKFPLQKLVLPAVLLAFIMITAAIINRSSSSVGRQRQAAPPPPVTAVQAVQPARSSTLQVRPAVAPVGSPGDQAPDNAKQAGQDSLQKLAPESPRGVIVRLKVTQNGTLTVTIDGARSQAYDLAVGDSIEWKADRTITLELTNAGGVDAELNGRALKPLGPSGKSAVVVLDAEGVRQ